MLNFYKSMARHADKHDIFEGSIVQAYADIRASRTYYSKLRELLVTSGCIEILRKGVSGSPSRVRLIRPPTEDDFEMTYTRRLTRRRHSDTVSLEQRVSNIEGRLGDIDIGTMAVNFEDRIKVIEKKAGIGR